MENFKIKFWMTETGQTSPSPKRVRIFVLVQPNPVLHIEPDGLQLFKDRLRDHALRSAALAKRTRELFR